MSLIEITSKKGVVADVSDLALGLDNMLELLEGRRKDILREGARLMEQETARAFSAGVDPSTGRAWPSRKHSYSWPILRHFGTLQRLLEFGWGVTQRNKSQRVFGKVKNVVYMQRSFRGGVGADMDMRKSAVEVAMSIYHGREHARTVEGWRQRRMGRGRITRRARWSRGGGKTTDAASRGTTPARPFFGFGRSARRQLRDFAAKRLEKAFE